MGRVLTVELPDYMPDWAVNDLIPIIKDILPEDAEFLEEELADEELIEAAREKYCLGSSDNIEIDDCRVRTSHTDEGVWVQAWVYIKKE